MTKTISNIGYLQSLQVIRSFFDPADKFLLTKWFQGVKIYIPPWLFALQ